MKGTQDIPPSPAEVPTRVLQTLEQYDYFLSNKTIFAEECEAWFHLKYEHIHPFLDGNGRTGRLSMLRGVLKDRKPPFVISSDERTKYIDFVSEYNTEGLVAMISDGCEKEAYRISQTVEVV